MSDGLLLTLEGLDGSGKSSVMDSIESVYPDAVISREPSPFWTGKQTRKAIESDDTHPLTDFHMFMADRAFHLKHRILPALEAGNLVVVDRYLDSTRAYQREALDGVVENPESFIEQALTPSVFVEPDLTILLDVDAETAAERSSDGDKYEASAFQKAARRNYRELAAQHDRLIELDATQPEDVMTALCSQVVEEARSQHFST